jgi:hypothetical protein
VVDFDSFVVAKAAFVVVLIGQLVNLILATVGRANQSLFRSVTFLLFPRFQSRCFPSILIVVMHGWVTIVIVIENCVSIVLIKRTTDIDKGMSL